MAIRKRKYKSGQVTWAFYFEAPGSTKENRTQVFGSGYTTKKQAVDAEAARRIEVQREYEAAARGLPLQIPRTLDMLLKEFFTQHGDRNLEQKTMKRYRELASYLAPELLALSIADLQPLYLTKEWNRLKDSGGHHRKTKEARPLSAKTVRNTAGVVASAFNWAMGQGITDRSPVTASTRPKGDRREQIAFNGFDQALALETSSHPNVPIILEIAAASGARRGEVLALRWSDLVAGAITVTRSLGQVGKEIFFKGTKTKSSRRWISLPDSTLKMIEEHRLKQNVFRQQFGVDYRTDLDLIICNPDGSPLRPDSISGTISNYLKRLKLGGSLHTMRHSHGSQLLADGATLTEVSARLGHSSPATTAAVYAHALKGRDAALAERWDKFHGRVKDEEKPAEKGKAN